jgi:hypothetical protein
MPKFLTFQFPSSSVESLDGVVAKDKVTLSGENVIILVWFSPLFSPPLGQTLSGGYIKSTFPPNFLSLPTSTTNTLNPSPSRNFLVL